MHEVENQRVGGEGRFYDERARRAVDQARSAEAFASDFLSAIRRNRATGRLESGHVNVPYDLASAIGDHLCDDAMAAALVNAMHLTLIGKYDEGSARLLDWMQAAANKYGVNTAELQAIGGE